MSVLDMNTFIVLKEATGADFIIELINTFLEDTPAQMATMKNALATKDVDAFRRAAHSIKSNAATFGAMDLANLARELEMLGRENNLEIGSRLEVMQDAFEQVKDQLNGLR